MDHALGAGSGVGVIGYSMVTLYTATIFILKRLGASTIDEDCKSAAKALAKVRAAYAQQMAALETDWVDVPTMALPWTPLWPLLPSPPPLLPLKLLQFKDGAHTWRRSSLR